MTYKTDAKWLLDIKYKGQTTTAYNKDLERLKSGEPLDYIIGHSDFLNTKISLLNKPLIPRQETEYWLEKALCNIDKNSEVDVLDIFAGSGCIGVATLRYLKRANVTFAEIRSELEETILENIRGNNLEERNYSIVVSNVFEKVTSKFDYIFANPPYILKERKTTTSSVLLHEPHDALFTDDNGLKYIKILINESPLYLKEGGRVFIEFDSWQKELLESYLEEHQKTYREVTFIVDQHDIPRVLRLSL